MPEGGRVPADDLELTPASARRKPGAARLNLRQLQLMGTHFSELRPQVPKVEP